MASLNTLRTKGSIAVTIVIFVALLAFLIGDIFTSGSTLFNSRKTRVGDINGKHINYVDFLNEADYLTSIYKMMWGRDAFSAQEQEMIYDMVLTILVLLFPRLNSVICLTAFICLRLLRLRLLIRLLDFSTHRCLRHSWAVLLQMTVHMLYGLSFAIRCSRKEQSANI